MSGRFVFEFGERVLDVSSSAASRNRAGVHALRRVAPRHVIEVQYALGRSGIPHPDTLRRWASTALGFSLQPTAYSLQPVSLTLRIVGTTEGRSLNRRWRSKDQPTNVLSFPAAPAVYPAMNEPKPLGDIVICAPVIRREAKEQSKAIGAHWAHMVVHGTLHLLGYDHEVERDAAVMERLEVRVLAGLGFPDPYFFKDAVPR